MAGMRPGRVRKSKCWWSAPAWFVLNADGLTVAVFEDRDEALACARHKHEHTADCAHDQFETSE